MKTIISGPSQRNLQQEQLLQKHLHCVPAKQLTKHQLNHRPCDWGYYDLVIFQAPLLKHRFSSHWFTASNARTEGCRAGTSGCRSSCYFPSSQGYYERRRQSSECTSAFLSACLSHISYPGTVSGCHNIQLGTAHLRHVDPILLSSPLHTQLLCCLCLLASAI